MMKTSISFAFPIRSAKPLRVSKSLDTQGKSRLKTALALFLLATASPAFADGLVENVNGITLDQDGKVIRFNAMLVGGDCKVTELLTKKDKLPKQLDFRLDGGGATLLPGLAFNC